MGVYIEGMEMPDSCNHCFVTPGCCPAVRKRIKSDKPGYKWIPANYRHEDCPLIEVPEPHGRLINEDALCEGRVSNDNVVICVKCAPTIIPASEEGADEKVQHQDR